MAILPPAPSESITNPAGAYFWNDWYTKLRDIVNNVANHNSLNGLQGGTATQRYHLTAAQALSAGGLIMKTIPTFADLSPDDVPASTAFIIKDLDTSIVRLVVNDAGVFKTVVLS